MAVGERLEGRARRYERRIDDKQRDEYVNVEIDAHRIHSSRSLRTAAAFSRGTRRPTRRLASHSTASGVIGLGGGETGVNL